MFDSLGSAPLQPFVKTTLVIWFVLLIPWFPFAGLAGMAFDGGDTAVAYGFVGSLWTYPILVAISFAYKRKQPRLVFLPLLTPVGVILSSLLPGKAH
jgi:hypothetical protein